MAKLWKQSGLTWQMIWLGESRLPCCIRSAVALQTHSLLLTRFIEMFRLYIHIQVILFRLEYLDHVFSIKAWGFSAAIWFICSYVSWRQRYGKAVFWMQALSDCMVKLERNYSLSPPLHSTTKPKGHCDFFSFQFETSSLKFRPCHTRFQSDLEAEWLTKWFLIWYEMKSLISWRAS